MKILLRDENIPKLDKVMSLISEINVLIAAEYKKSGDWKSKTVEEIDLWSNYLDVNYDGCDITFQFLEKLSAVVKKHGYEIHEQRRSTHDYNTKIVLKEVESE
jgi:hypothetical protein